MNTVISRQVPFLSVPTISCMVLLIVLLPASVHAVDLLSSDTPDLPYSQVDSDTVIPSRDISFNSFSSGEKIVFRVNYLGFTGGYITLKINKTQIDHRPIYKVNMKARTSGIAEYLYPIRSKAVSYLDPDGVFSWGFDYAIDSSDEYDTEMLRYYQTDGHWIQNGSLRKSMPKYTQDVLSALYYIRSKPIEVGKTFRVPVQVGEKNYMSVLRVDKVETLAINGDWKEAYRISPTLESDTNLRDAKSRLKDEASGVYIWISKDSRKIPLQISLPAYFGSLYGYLESYSP